MRWETLYLEVDNSSPLELHIAGFSLVSAMSWKNWSLLILSPLLYGEWWESKSLKMPSSIDCRATLFNILAVFFKS